MLRTSSSRLSEFVNHSPPRSDDEMRALVDSAVRHDAKALAETFPAEYEFETSSGILKFKKVFRAGNLDIKAGEINIYKTGATAFAIIYFCRHLRGATPKACIDNAFDSVRNNLDRFFHAPASELPHGVSDECPATRGLHIEGDSTCTP